jgi:hypothetical protein
LIAPTFENRIGGYKKRRRPFARQWLKRRIVIAGLDLVKPAHDGSSITKVGITGR